MTSILMPCSIFKHPIVCCLSTDSAHERAFVHPDRDECWSCAHDEDRRLATGHKSGDVCIWHAVNFQLMVHVKPHELFVTSLLFYSKRTLVSASSDHAVKMLDKVTGTCEHTFKVASQAARLAKLNGKLYVGVFQQGVVKFDLNTHVDGGLVAAMPGEIRRIAFVDCL